MVMVLRNYRSWVQVGGRGWQRSEASPGVVNENTEASVLLGGANQGRPIKTKKGEAKEPTTPAVTRSVVISSASP